MSLTRLTGLRLSLKKVSPIFLMEKQLITMTAPGAVFQSMMAVRIKVAGTAAANKHALSIEA
jgi:hypothetical protein